MDIEKLKGNHEFWRPFGDVLGWKDALLEAGDFLIVNLINSTLIQIQI